MKKAIVSGANGFVGSAVVRELINNDYNVMALVNNGNADRLPIDERIKVVSFDIRNPLDYKREIEGFGADTFYHFAWSGSAGQARADIRLQLNNALWTIECVKFAKEIGCKRFINAGSIMEIETYRAAFSSGNRPGLGYIYGSGKLVAHTMCKSVAANIGIELLWGMITNAYGPGEMSPRMVNTTIRKCINNEAPQFTAGTQNYDFVYIDDVARAFRLIGENGKSFCEYTIGSGNAKPLKEFLLEMKSAIAPDLEFIFGDIPFTGINLSLDEFSTETLFNDTGFCAEIPFREGCIRTMHWLKGIEKNDSAI